MNKHVRNHVLDLLLLGSSPRMSQKKKRMECEDLMKRRLKAILKFFYCNCFYLQEKRFELSDPDMHLLACVKRS